MNKIFNTLILLSLFLPVLVLAADVISIDNPLKADSFEEIINNIIDFIFTLSIAIVPLMIVWAGGLYVTSGGDEKKITTARNIITYALSGLAIVLLSKGFVAIIKQLLGT